MEDNKLSNIKLRKTAKQVAKYATIGGISAIGISSISAPLIKTIGNIVIQKSNQDKRKDLMKENKQFNNYSTIEKQNEIINNMAERINNQTSNDFYQKRRNFKSNSYYKHRKKYKRYKKNIHIHNNISLRNVINNRK